MCLFFFLCIISFYILKCYVDNTKVKVAAFIRIKNEINTIEACLNSIKDVFDKIVIIHSNEPDDGMNKLAHQWYEKKKKM